MYLIEFTAMRQNIDEKANTLAPLSDFFNNHHDKLVCTANKHGVPNVSIMGTPRIMGNGDIVFQISDPVSVTLDNMRENKEVVFMAYLPGERARDYQGVRIHTEVTEIVSAGEKFGLIKEKIRERFGKDKADELLASITCRVKKVRPVVDRGQQWNEPPM
jgi:hypothetical protein